MWGKQSEQKWGDLPNPFVNASLQIALPSSMDEAITSHVSGRRTDITQIITERQSANILTGTPYIGKSTLIRYLKRSPNAEWSWRNELDNLYDQMSLKDIYFAQVDLTPLKSLEDVGEFRNFFVAQCSTALQSVYQEHGKCFSPDMKGMRELLRVMNSKTPNARCFLMLDSIDRIGGLSSKLFRPESRAQSSQDHGLSLLDNSGAIRVLVDLIDEFRSFGVIFSIQSLPRSRMEDQFTYVSADLARFATTALQAFPWEEAQAFLSQRVENFRGVWPKIPEGLEACPIFSKAEQMWILEQAGTHPYLLQKFCREVFSLKQKNIIDSQTEQENIKGQIIELVNTSLSIFLANIWQRLQEALNRNTREIRSRFYEFVDSWTQKQAENVIKPTDWQELGSELHYILSSEGIVRYDHFKDVHYPGSTLRNHLIQKVKELQERSPSPTISAISGHALFISIEGKPRERLQLSQLEYSLLRILLQHPKNCTEEELMKGAWGKIIERAAFTQRMHQLRKKLKERFGGTEIIENRYGGQYSLNHPEWFHLD